MKSGKSAADFLSQTEELLRRKTATDFLLPLFFFQFQTAVHEAERTISTSPQTAVKKSELPQQCRE